MRWSVILCLLAACAGDRTNEVPEVGSHGAFTMQYPDFAPQKVDILFVIDSSPAMAPFHDHVKQVLGDVALKAAARFGGGARTDVHVGVITSDLGDGAQDGGVAMPGGCSATGDGGMMRRSALVDGAFIVEHRRPMFDHSNYSGQFYDAMVALTDVSSTGCPRAQPLEAIRLALADSTHNAGFLRDDAKLAIVIVSAQDDASPLSVDEYRQLLHSLKTDDDDVMLAVAAPDGTSCGTAPSPRLAELAGARFTSLCSDSLPSFVFDNACVPAPDGSEPIICLDQPTTGECAASDDGGSYRECSETQTSPCWRIAPSNACGEGESFTIDRGDADPATMTNYVTVQCVTR